MSVPYEIIRFQKPDIERKWLEHRKLGIGGSDVSSLMGLSKYKGPYALWAEKTGVVEPEDISDKPQVIVGNVLEGIIRKWFRKMHPELVVTASNCMLRSKERPWAQASLDGVCHVRGAKKSDPSSYAVLEIKTVGEMSVKDWYDESGNLVVPIYYLCQVTHYLSVTGWQKAYVAALFGNREFVEIEVNRDEDDIQVVNKAVDVFWSMVETRQPPSPLGLDGESRALFQHHSQPAGEFKGVSGVPRSVADYIEAKERADLWKGELDAAKNRLKAEIGDADGIESEDFRIKWVRATSTRFDERLFREENPELYEKYRRPAKRDMGLRYTDKTKKKGK